MSLRKGAETIVHESLDVGEEEKVVVVNDGNDKELVDAVLEVVDGNGNDREYIEYPEPQNHGVEPPAKVAEALERSDVFIAPTVKSISHTRARIKACESGSRGVTLPGITREIWNTGLQSDYERVREICGKVYSILEDSSELRVSTPSGTDLSFDIEPGYWGQDTGIVRQPGEFGNLPAGEVDGGAVNAEGRLVVDHAPFLPGDTVGAEIEVSGSEVVAFRGDEGSELARAFENVPGARNVAEIGFGTNPEAAFVGNVLQDEKILGTVHVALGDNSAYFPADHPRHTESGIHWDFVCRSPTVHFDDRKMLDEGEPVFDY